MDTEKKEKIDKKVWIISGAGVAIGIGEALLYYNLGKNATRKSFKFGIPKGRELYQTLAVVAVTSVLTAMLSKGIENAMHTDLRQGTMG
jgi:hypothetical protein